MSLDSSPAVDAARAYEELHVNALFREWADPMLDAAGVGVGGRILDVACGTGVVARQALGRVGDAGSVTGLDLGEGMLTVARDLEPGVRWVSGNAGALPFEDAQFDAGVCSFGLMFFPDRARAIREMCRCVGENGRVAVSVWEELEKSQAYPIVVELLDRLAGPSAADALRAPFVLGDTERLIALFDEAGCDEVTIRTRVGTARFPGIRSMVEADLRGWLPVMGVQLDESLIQTILAEAESALAEFVTKDGMMVFEAPAHIVTVKG